MSGGQPLEVDEPGVDSRCCDAYHLFSLNRRRVIVVTVTCKQVPATGRNVAKRFACESAADQECDEKQNRACDRSRLY